MSLLIYSPKCSHSLEVIKFIDANPQLRQLVHYHNVSELGIPDRYRQKITRVPTMLTKNGKLLVGNEIKAWLESLLPSKNGVQPLDIVGKCNLFNLDGDDDNGMFAIEDYGQSLQPALTPEIEERIKRNVSDAYNQIKNS